MRQKTKRGKREGQSQRERESERGRNEKERKKKRQREDCNMERSVTEDTVCAPACPLVLCVWVLCLARLQPELVVRRPVDVENQNAAGEEAHRVAWGEEETERKRHLGRKTK